MELGNELSFALLDKYVCKAYHILYTHKDINFPMFNFNHFFIELIGAFPKYFNFCSGQMSLEVKRKFKIHEVPASVGRALEKR